MTGTTTYVLGLNGSHHGTSACVVAFANGSAHVLAMVEQERLSRIKNDGAFPAAAIKEALAVASVRPERVDRVTFGWNGIAHNDGTYARWLTELLAENDAKCIHRRSINSLAERWSITALRQNLEQNGLLPRGIGIDFVPHHFAHAVSAYVPSRFDRALIITLDGFGDDMSTVVWEAREAAIRPLRTFSVPNSLGYFYSMATEYLGYRAIRDEGTVMALAGWGHDHVRRDRSLARLYRSVKAVVDDTLRITAEGYRLDVDRLSFFRAGSRRYSDVFEQRMAPLVAPRIGAVGEEHMVLAAAFQSRLEEVVQALVRRYFRTEHRNICFAGGVALNCTMNGSVLRMRDELGFDRFFVPPTSGDEGTALGAAFAHDLAASFRSRDRLGMALPFLGRQWAAEDVDRSILLGSDVAAEIVDLGRVGAAGIAEALAEGSVVGVVQGRAEVGPRALGHRSLLAQATEPRMRDRINEIKGREWFRPVAPVILEEHFRDVVTQDEPCSARFMNVAFHVQPHWRGRIPAALHVDGTVRPQVVSAADGLVHDVLREYDSRTGIPVLLNSSLNAGEPMAYSIEDALRCFRQSSLDLLWIEGRLLAKARTRPAPRQRWGSLQSSSRVLPG